MDELETVLATLRDRLDGLRERYKVERIRVYGSVARGEARPGSDLDLMVEFGNGASLFDLVGMQQELEGELGRRVDITTPTGLHPIVLAEAMHDAIEVEA